MSLLELVIVLMVVGLMAAVAAPRFASTMRAAHVRAAAIQIAGHIRYVRRIAINEGRSTSLSFDDSNSTYQSIDVDFPSRLGKRIDVVVNEDFDGSITIASNLDGTSNLTFDLEGVPHVNGSLLSSGIITISSPGVPSFEILIAAGTGETTIQPVTQPVTQPNAPAGPLDIKLDAPTPVGGP